MLFALGMAASACGSGSTTTDAAPAGESSSASTSTDNGSAEDDSTEPSSGTDTSTTASSADEGEEPAADPTATLANYPQVDVIDLGSGETVDFAEQVAGGSLPTLIWFWAPH